MNGLHCALTAEPCLECGLDHQASTKELEGAMEAFMFSLERAY